MKKIIFILLMIFITGCSINIDETKKENISPRFYEKSDDYYKSGFKEDLIEIKNIIENDELMKSISSNLHTKVVDFNGEKTVTVAAYTSIPKYGVTNSPIYGKEVFLEKNIKKGNPDSVYIQAKEENLDDYFFIERDRDLENSIVDLLADERTIELSKYELENIFFKNGLRCYIYEKVFDDGMIIRVLSVNENYSLNHFKIPTLNFIQTFNKDGLLSSQSITTDANIQIMDMVLVNGNDKHSNRLILFVSNLNDTTGYEMTTVRSELYFLEFSKYEYKGSFMFYWKPAPIKIKQTIYDGGFFIDNEEDNNFDIKYFFDGISMGVHQGVFFDMLEEIEKGKSFFIISKKTIFNRGFDYYVPEINDYKLPVFIKYDILD